ncbi:hypothetical protein J6590_009689 [Homalodisca vitripennis]|nr:hypothetical protein J6590_009689 [Homalodisca vitripennis]
MALSRERLKRPPAARGLPGVDPPLSSTNRFKSVEKLKHALARFLMALTVTFKDNLLRTIWAANSIRFLKSSSEFTVVE